MIMKGLLVAGIFSTVMASQPQIVQIKPSTADLEATGVHLVPLDDIGHTATVEAILGEDRAMVAPALPYGVLVVNGSSRKLTAIAVTFIGQNAEGQKTRVIIITAAYPPATALAAFPPALAASLPGAISPIAPGASLLFTPDSSVNQYLAKPWADRKRFSNPCGAQIACGPRIVVSGMPPATDFPSSLQQRLSSLFIGGAVELQVNLEGTAFDDDSYAGSQYILDSLKKDKPGLHR